MTKYDMVAFSGETTRFYFDAPADKPKAVETGLLFFKDIANGLSLTDADINNVKGELQQEFLMKMADRLNEAAADKKLRAGFFPCIQDEPDFLENLGKQENEVFRRFYRDWYRPDLLTLSIVGNIKDIDALEQQLTSTFSDLVSPENPRKKLNCDSLFYEREPQFITVERVPKPSAIIPDTEVELQIIFRDITTFKNISNKQGLKRLFLARWLGEILNKRFKDNISDYDSFPVFVEDGFKHGRLPSLQLEANFDDAITAKEAIQNISEVIKQVQKFGVSDSEWRELKLEQLNNFEQQADNTNDYWSRGIQKYILKGEALPENKKGFLQDLLLSIPLDDFNAFVTDFLDKQPEDIGIIAPTGHQSLALTEEQVRSWIKEVYKKATTPYQPLSVPQELMDSEEISKLRTAEIHEDKFSKSGAHHYLLNNGIKLILKPLESTLSSEKNKVIIHGFALKGASCFPSEQFFSAVYSPQIIRNAGVNGLNKFELERYLSKRDLLPGLVTSYIGREESGIQGSSSKKDLDLLLQLIYLTITSPNKDVEAFKDWKRSELKSYVNDERSWIVPPILDNAIGDRSILEFSQQFGDKFLKKSRKMLEGIPKINLDDSYEAYHKIFGDAGDFTFIISGDFEVDSVLALASKYLGNLPTSNSVSCPKNVQTDFQTAGPVFELIKAPENYEMKNVLYQIAFVKPAQSQSDWKEQYLVEALSRVTEEKAWRLRFGMGLAVYNVSVYGRFNPDIKRYEISSSFSCKPDEYPIIKNEMHKIISELKSGEISADEFKGGMATMHLFYDLDKRGGRILAQSVTLYKQFRYGQSWVEPSELEDFLNSLTIEDITEAANKYYQEENRYELFMTDKPF